MYIFVSLMCNISYILNGRKDRISGYCIKISEFVSPANSTERFFLNNGSDGRDIFLSTVVENPFIKNDVDCFIMVNCP